MSISKENTGLKVGLYIDVANLSLNGGFGLRYDVLREFVCRGGAEPMRLNAYVSYDSDRAVADHGYKASQYGFHSVLRDLGFKVIEKRVKWFTDEHGNRFGKANVDLDLAVDALLQSENMDRVLMATGDGDFVQVVRALQNKGCRVEVVAFDNVSADLRREADSFISGYLIPNLLPVQRGRSWSAQAWGDVGSVVRGVCCSHDPDKPYGFLRFLQDFNAELWKTDTRQPDSPYRTIFCHDSELPEEVRVYDLPSRSLIFEFEIAEGEPGKGQKAVNVTRIMPKSKGGPGRDGPVNRELPFKNGNS